MRILCGVFGISVVESSGEEKAAAAKESRAHSIDEHHRRLGLGHSAGAGRHSLMRAHFPADFQQRVSEASGADQRRTEPNGAEQIGLRWAAPPWFFLSKERKIESGRRRSVLPRPRQPRRRSFGSFFLNKEFFRGQAQAFEANGRGPSSATILYEQRQL